MTEPEVRKLDSANTKAGTGTETGTETQTGRTQATATPPSQSSPNPSAAPDPAAPDAAATDAAATDAAAPDPAATVSGGNGPRPRPTPTGRARRAAAAAVGSGTEVRRPSPVPRSDQAARPASTAGTTQPASKASTRSTAATPTAADEPVRRGRRAKVVEPVTATPIPARSTHGGARSPLWVALVLGGLALAGVAALLVALLLPVKAGTSSERDQALAAAKSEVPLILSYDYKNFDAGLAKSKAVLTGRAVTDYAKAMTTSIKPTAVKAKAVVQASTDGAGVESVSPDGKQVTVVVFGEQKVTNSTLSAPRTDLFRVRATLDLIGGHWLVSKFDQI